MKVKAITDYFDLELKRLVNKDEEYEISKARAEKLSTTANAAGMPLVIVLEEKPEKPKKKDKKDE